MKRIARVHLEPSLLAWKPLSNMVAMDVKGFPRATKYQSLELATFLLLAVLPTVRKLSMESIDDAFSSEDIWLDGPEISGVEDLQFHPNTVRPTSIAEVWGVSDS
jgi:hypothetical protein